MNVKKYTATILKASEGHFLTEAEDKKNICRIVADTICLAREEDIDLWKEITEEEGLAIRRELEEYGRKMMEEENIL